MRCCFRARWLGISLSLAIGCSWARGNDLHFDYTSFDNPGTPGANPHFGQNQFNVLNYPSINGNYMMTSTDAHRPDMVANGNTLAEFYNFLQARYNENPIASAAPTAAAEINSYALKNSNNNGPRPDWIVLNEISSSGWQLTDPTYKNWVIGVATALHQTYGYNVVTYAPFATVGVGNSAYWQQLAAVSCIGVENYLSGAEVMAGGSSYASRVAWAESQYQMSVSTYGVAGVPISSLFMGEDFANSASGTSYGRAGIPASDWDTVIQIRQDAIRSLGFRGFLAYAWGSNAMGVTEAEQMEHEYYYRTRLVLPGQQPQWLSDDAINVNGTVIPLSWNQELNWLGGVPDAGGAIANFYMTNTTARTITLDGSKTVGTLSFDSSSSYTISPGTGGSLTLDDGGIGAHVTIPLGAHVVNVPVVIADNATFNVGTTLSLSAGLSSTIARTMTRTGAGTLNIAGNQSYAAGEVFNANSGVTNFNSSADGNLAINVSNAVVNFNSAQDLASLSIAGGKVDLKDNVMVIRSGSVGSPTAGVYSGISGYVQSGRNGGAWNGNGIITSQSAAQGSAGLTTVAVAAASDAMGISGSQTASWMGQTVDSDSVLVMYTYAGDANLDGRINGDDYFRIDSSVNDPNAAVDYFDGDFNYDGKINGDDYFIIDSNINQQGAALDARSLSALLNRGTIGSVPEPATTAVLVLSVLALSGRRRLARR